jgi:hypothetical protein
MADEALHITDSEILRPNSAIGSDGFEKYDSLHSGSFQIGSSQVGPSQIGFNQVGTGQVSIHQASIGQIGSGKIRESQISPSQVTVSEVSFSEASLPQSRMSQIGSSHIDFLQVLLAQIGITQVNLSQVTLRQFSPINLDTAKISLPSSITLQQFLSSHNFNLQNTTIPTWTECLTRTTPFNLNIAIADPLTSHPTKLMSTYLTLNMRELPSHNSQVLDYRLS